MKLYYHPASTTSRTVMMLAAEDGIDLEYELVDLMTGEHLKPAYAAINPNRLVPVLEDGEFRMCESSAILKYLAEKTGSPAYPEALQAKAKVNEAMDWFNANFYKDFGYGLIYPQLFPWHRRPDAAVQAGTIAWAKEKSKGWLTTLDQTMIGAQKSFLCGDRATIADYFGAEIVELGATIRCNWSPYPNVARWLSNMRAIASWPKVHEAFYGWAASLKDTPFEAI